MRKNFGSLFFLGALLLSGAAYADDAINQLKEETLSYFRPLKGRVVSVSGSTITSDLGAPSGVKKGMRVMIFREGTPFLHPVTKEPMGRVETPGGKAQVKDVSPDGSTLEILKGDAREGDILRVSEMKVKVLFYQDRNVDWNLADAYHQALKESGRLELLDTSLDSADDAQIIDEAKKVDAGAVFILTAKESEKEVLLRQRILWVEDSAGLADREVRVDMAAVKEFRAARNMLAPLSSAGDVLFYFDIPFSATLVASGDLEGNGKRELIIGYGRELRVYSLGASLSPLYEHKGSRSDEYLWVDVMDVNGDGKDEIIATAMRGRQVDIGSESAVPVVKDEGKVVSYIYERKGSEFSVLWKTNGFLRTLPFVGLIGQDYDEAEGFSGPVFRVNRTSGAFTRGDAIKLPAGVNIYDFSYVTGPDGSRYTLAYDNSGYMSVYSDDGLRVWQSREGYLGFRKSFKKSAPTVMADRGEWSVKDRLFVRGRESFVVKRIPLADMVRGLGFKSSQIKTVWWTGLSMEENVLIDGISGGVMDYTFIDDKLVVLSSPLFGFKAQNILKGESPMGSMLYIYSLKGR
jgi:hypothetical protein